ncbi:MAG: MFS transporter [Aeromicrobium sp.]|uniref:MFS transporter n=1 Tax=Aeromicrobium sp. TaxID=1871063 RepID=UPI0039E2E78A
MNRDPSAVDHRRTFAGVLVNTALANLTTSFLWWALIFWIYLETRSVLASGVVGGSYMLFVAVGSIAFGTVVDRHPKLRVMRWSTFCTLAAFMAAGALYAAVPAADLLDLGRPWLWLFTAIILAGAVVENMRNIALSTSVTILVPDGDRDRANGLVGTVQGLAMVLTSVFSGLSVGYLGMGWTVVIALVLTALSLAHLLTLSFPAEEIDRSASSGMRGSIDLAGSVAAIAAAPGLMALIVFSTFNNLIGGTYMALMDPYGIELFTVQGWGLAFAIASTGFIVGGMAVARFGLGVNPLRTMLVLVVVMGVVGTVFVVREWGWLFVAGTWAFMALMPAAEAAEQTVVQRVVPLERQGRVFGFAMAFESAAAPVSSFLVAPVAEFWVIPYARSQEGAAALEPWLGTGEVRGIALVLVVTGLLMVAVAALAFCSRSYRLISQTYLAAVPSTGTEGEETAARSMSGEGV